MEFARDHFVEVVSSVSVVCSLCVVLLSARGGRPVSPCRDVLRARRHSGVTHRVVSQPAGSGTLHHFFFFFFFFTGLKGALSLLVKVNYFETCLPTATLLLFLTHCASHKNALCFIPCYQEVESEPNLQSNRVRLIS